MSIFAHFAIFFLKLYFKCFSPYFKTFQWICLTFSKLIIVTLETFISLNPTLLKEKHFFSSLSKTRLYFSSDASCLSAKTDDWVFTFRISCQLNLSFLQSQQVVQILMQQSSPRHTHCYHHYYYTPDVLGFLSCQSTEHFS